MSTPLPITFSLAVAIAFAQPSPLTPLARTISGAVNASNARETTKQIYATDRFFTFPKFAETAETLQTILTATGARQIQIESLAADGRSQSGFWTAPLAWDVESAILEMREPERATLCDYAQTPACLGMWSGPTPPAGLTAELVDLDSTPWAQVRNKLVLTSQNSAGLKARLVQHGALGAVNGFSENPELPNDRQWINAWGDHGWAFTRSSTPLLSYSVTPAQAARLRALLAAGKKVVLHARAQTRLYEGAYPWVTAILPGTHPGEEVLALAHTSEQGANDNATGVAATIEALRALTHLIATNQLPRPRRSIRVLLMPEMYGSLAYITRYPQRLSQTLAAITVDTPAASYDLAGTEYTAYKNPHAAKSWTDPLLARIARATLPRRRPFHTAEHTTGTDAYLGDPTIGVPNPWLYSGTGVTTHHNTADTPDTVDLRSLSDLTAMVATYLYFTANAGPGDVPWLASLIVDAAAEDFANTAAAGLDALSANDRPAAAFALARLSYLADRNQEALQSLHKIAAHPAIANAAQDIRAQLQAHTQRFHNLLPYSRKSEPDGATLIVRRKRIGTLPLDDLPAGERQGFPSGAWDKMVTVALYWCDGKRTVNEVARLTELELGRPLTFPFGSYFRFLEQHGYVEFVR